MAYPKSKIVVVDSGAFIKNAKIEDYAEDVYTVQAVVKEIRDKQTRNRLQLLPYKINFREPTQQAIAHVSETAKQTGDFRSLSATDIRVIALTYELHEQLKKCNPTEASAEDEKFPVNKVSYRDAFGDVDSDDDDDEYESCESCESDHEEAAALCSEEPDEMEDESEEQAGDDMDSSDEEIKDNVLEKVTEESKCQAMEAEDDDFDDDWITADNFSSHNFGEDFQTFKSSSSKEEDAVEVPPAVSCLTTDFAMQNVLLRLGLSIRSVDGLIVKAPKSFVLWCYACNKHTLDQLKQFCPACGNKCLRKVTASIDGDGKVNLHFAKKFQWRNKGKNKQTDPHFRGGKYSNNPIYTEDQPMPHQRPSKKALQRLDPEASCVDSPFANRDLSSRAAKLGMNKRFRGGRRK